MFSKKPLCKAPFVNIFIDPEGNVTPCCFNRNDIFGNIYRQEIDEIWNSAKAQNLRKLLNSNQFPENCKICKKSIESGNYYNSGVFIYSKFNYKKVKIQTIDFELSYKCNLNCIMCNLHSTKYFLTTEMENTILLRLKQVLKNLQRAQFYGGEPLVIPIYYKIWNNIVEQNPKTIILIQTNGTIINEEIKSIAKKGKLIFNISIDSINPELLSEIRNGSNFKNIMNNIQQFKKLSKKRITLAITPMQLNWKEIPKLIDFANKNNFQIFFNNMIQPKKMSLWYLPSNKIKEIILYYNNNNNFTFNYESIINYFRFKHFIKTLEQYYSDALNRPNYNNDELILYSELIYQSIIEKLPQFQDFSKLLFISKISEYLYLHSYEKTIEFINNTTKKELERAILYYLNNEE